MSKLLKLLIYVFFLSSITPCIGENVMEINSITIEQSAIAIFNEGLISGLRLKSEEKGVILDSTVLIEDDSPGAGTGQEQDGGPISAKIYDEITRKTWIKKELYVDNPKARLAVIAFYGYESASNIPLLITINGNSVVKQSFRKSLPKRYQGKRLSWFYKEFSPSFLKKGKNEIIFYTESEEHPWRVFISEGKNFRAGSNNPDISLSNNSAKSKNGGKTWDYEHLGVKDTLDGEYNIRLSLDRFCNEGYLSSPVIDLGTGSDEKDIISNRVEIKGVSIKAEGETPFSTAIFLETRCGNTVFYSPGYWSIWKEIKKGEVISPRGRYLQWRARLSTEDVLVTPILKKVVISVKKKIFNSPDTGRMKVIDAHNEKIIRGSYPYQYEKYDQPELVKLRKKYKLDEVVKGGKTEFEKILLLKDWVAGQNLILLKKEGYSFPPWDANYIIEKHGWFCLHYAITFMQACLSFGIQARHVQMNSFFSGHEVAEVWSNDYKKWVYMDPEYNIYLYDKKTKIPLSLQEVQQGMWEHQKQDQLVELLGTKVPLKVVADEFPLGFNIGSSYMRKKFYSSVENTRLVKSKITKCFFLRIIPRNNFLSQKYPLPLNHGTTHWPWNGYLNWCDEHTPRLPQYSKFIYKKGDMYWTLNQVSYKLIYGKKPGEIIVGLDTVTPDFETFLAKIDGKDWEMVSKVFTWKLHNGINKLELCSRNRAGIKGIVSYITLSYLTN